MVAAYIAYIENVLVSLDLYYAYSKLYGFKITTCIESCRCRIQSLLTELSLLDEGIDDDVTYFHEIKYYIQNCLDHLNLTKILDLDYSNVSVGTAPVVLASMTRVIFTLLNAGATDGLFSGYTLPTKITFTFVDVTLIGYNRLTIGDGVKTSEAYFSNDLGVTAKDLDNLATGDRLYLNSAVIGIPLTLQDQLEIIVV